jgi:hypothetical protein
MKVFFLLGVVVVIIMAAVPAMARDLTAEELNARELARIIGTSKAKPEATTTALGYGTAPPAQQVNNIGVNLWWNIIPNFQGHQQTACVVINYNSNPVYVTFDVYPFFVCNNQNNPQCIAHEKTSVLLGSPQSPQPPNLQPIFGFDDGTQPPPQCSLLSWQ